MKKFSKEELIKKSEIPMDNALKMHPFYRGKLQVMPRCQIKDYQDFGIWYSPGVAAPCMEIYNDVEKSYLYTSRWNYVGVVSDGTRVLGLGNLGPEGGLPEAAGRGRLSWATNGNRGPHKAVRTRAPRREGAMSIRFISRLERPPGRRLPARWAGQKDRPHTQMERPSVTHAER